MKVTVFVGGMDTVGDMNLMSVKQTFIVTEIPTVPYIITKRKNQVLYGTLKRKIPTHKYNCVLSVTDTYRKNCLR